MSSLVSKVASCLHVDSHSSTSLMNASPTAVAAREEQLRKARSGDAKHPPPKDTPMALSTQNQVKLDPQHPMLALEWHGTKHVEMAMRARPLVTDPKDMVVRVTSTTICGSDLHMYVNEVPGMSTMKAGDILGHEFMGVVEEVGSGCTTVKKGDRVLVAACISCGECEFCKEGKPTLCDFTNPSGQMEELYGHRLSGILGYSHLTGGFSGGQAEYARVPFGDVNHLHVPPELTDKQVLLLTDVASTGWHANEMGEVREGDTVCVWGAGPIGMMAGYLALRLKKAKRVLIVDCIPYRLQMATRLGMEPIDFSAIEKGDVVAELRKRVPGGPDRCLECVGYRTPRGWLHKIMRGVKLETDSAEIITDMVRACKKGGNIGCIGDYFAFANAFPLGHLMEKNITFRGGQLFLHKYWQFLLSKVQDGTIDLAQFITHQAKFSQGKEAYQLFDNKEDEVMKIQLLTDYGLQRAENNDVNLHTIQT